MANNQGDIQVDRLKNQQIALQKAEIATLRTSLLAFVNENRSDLFNEDAGDASIDMETEPEQSLADATDDEEETLPDAVWDIADAVFRCSECVWEVVDGICHSCGTEHNCTTDDDEDIQVGPSISTNNESLSSDRSLAPRGTTPILEIRNESAQVEHEDSATYRSLLSRGATPLMCETFHLEFTPECGIFAWADDDIYDTFSGPAMQDGDFWKIHLGRRVELDKDDLDGSQFITGLLEDALLFPLRSPSSYRIAEQWETVQETSGIWVTRMMIDEQADSDSDSDIDGSEFQRDLEDREDDRASPADLPVMQYDQLDYDIFDASVESVTASDRDVDSDSEMMEPANIWEDDDHGSESQLWISGSEDSDYSDDEDEDYIEEDSDEVCA